MGWSCLFGSYLQEAMCTVTSISSVCLQVSLFLKDSWITTLRANIRTCLRDVGKGWFNIHETNWEVYQISKLKKFMEMVKFIMQVQCYNTNRVSAGSSSGAKL